SVCARLCSLLAALRDDERGHALLHDVRDDIDQRTGHGSRLDGSTRAARTCDRLESSLEVRDEIVRGFESDGETQEVVRDRRRRALRSLPVFDEALYGAKRPPPLEQRHGAC